jgi:hypothetical protein
MNADHPVFNPMQTICGRFAGFNESLAGERLIARYHDLARPPGLGQHGF